MTFGEALLQGSKEAMCGYLANGGNLAATNFIVGGAMTPGGQLPAAAGALGLLALNYGCTYDPNKVTPTPGLEGSVCKDADKATFFDWRGPDGTLHTGPNKNYGVVVHGKPEPFAGGRIRLDVSFRSLSPTAPLVRDWLYLDAGSTFIFRPESGCVSASPVGGGPPGPHTYTDPSTNCTYVYELQNVVLDESGNAQPVFKVSPGPTTRSSGGIIGGCNFDPIVYGGPGGGGPGGGGGEIVPWVPGPDGPGGLPWWYPLLVAAAGGAVSAAVGKMLDAIFKETVEGRMYRLISACETNADGEAVSLSREVSIPTLDLMKAAIYRLDALEYLLQGLKDFKQPICGTTVKPVLRTGEPVTVTFMSDEVSPQGNGPLVKKFNYRDQTNAPLVDHVSHWDGFVWQAGPVCVINKGTAMGVPQVWAATAEEGKRVIRHAAQVAGVDVDAEPAHWIVTGTADNRYGNPGTMRVSRKGGTLWVHKRPGPSGRGDAAIA